MYRRPTRRQVKVVSVTQYAKHVKKALAAQGVDDLSAQLYALGKAAELQANEDETIIDFPPPRKK